MNGAKGKLADFTRRLKTEIRQDKKNTTLLAILLITAGIVGGRFVVTCGLPDKAAAGSSYAVETDTDGDDQTGLGRSSERPAQEVDSTSIDRTITRDLFRPDTKYFPSADRADESRRAGTANQPDQAQQLTEAQQQEQQKRFLAEHIKSIHTQAEALCLMSTMLGRSPTALINGQVLQTGDLINGFHLKSIAPDYCIVTRDGVDVKLQMRK